MYANEVTPGKVPSFRVGLGSQKTNYKITVGTFALPLTSREGRGVEN